MESQSPILDVIYSEAEKKQLTDIKRRYEAFKTSETIDVVTPTRMEVEIGFDGVENSPYLVFSRERNYKDAYYWRAPLDGCHYERVSTTCEPPKRVEVGNKVEAYSRAGWHMAEDLLSTVAVPNWARTVLSKYSVRMAKEMAPIWAAAAHRSFEAYIEEKRRLMISRCCKIRAENGRYTVELIGPLRVRFGQHPCRSFASHSLAAAGVAELLGEGK